MLQERPALFRPLIARPAFAAGPISSSDKKEKYIRDRLSFATLEKQGYTGYLLKDAPEKIVQFGEGNFLRAFADNFVDLMNEKADFNAKVVLVQPRGGHPEAADRFGEQDGLYTLILRGRENGEPVENTRIISAASRCLDPKRDWEKLLDCARNPELRFVISNTTEAGIAFDPACKAEDTPPSAFPAKLTLFLHERWKKGFKGIIILSCELIDHNGQEDLPLQPTGEEGILLIRALCGLDRLVSNVNIPNSALQIPNLPAHTVVETNALFEKDAVRPVFAGAMPE